MSKEGSKLFDKIIQQIYNFMLKIVLPFLILFFIGVIHAQTTLPFTPLNETRVLFTTVTTTAKLNIYKNYYYAIKCAPTLTINYTPKQNTYLSYYTMQWSRGGVNVLYRQIDVGQYLNGGQAYKIAENMTTFNCISYNHDELNFQPGFYSFVFTMWDNNLRKEVIGKVAISDQLSCVEMTTGCWQYTTCEPYGTNCGKGMEKEIEEQKQ